MKWYDNILNTLRDWFSTPDATEAEIHSEMEKIGGIDGLRSSIKAEVAEEHKAEVEKLTAQIEQLQSDLSKANDSLAASQQSLTESQQKVSELEARVAAVPTGVKSGGSPESNTGEMPVWEAFKKQFN